MEEAARVFSGSYLEPEDTEDAVKMVGRISGSRKHSSIIIVKRKPERRLWLMELY